MFFKIWFRIQNPDIQKGFPNECKSRYMIYGGNRMVFSSENFLSFMQSTRRTVQNFSTRKSRPLKIKQGIPFVEFKTRCENSKALLYTNNRRRPCKRRESHLNMFYKTKLSGNMPSDPFLQNEMRSFIVKYCAIIPISIIFFLQNTLYQW